MKSNIQTFLETSRQYFDLGQMAGAETSAQTNVHHYDIVRSFIMTNTENDCCGACAA